VTDKPAKATVEYIEERYIDIFSSPTRQGFFDFATCVNNEVLNREHLNKFSKDRQARLERLNQRSKIHYGAKSTGDLMSLIRVQDLREMRGRQIEIG
jgi:hypothetical protein